MKTRRRLISASNHIIRSNLVRRFFHWFFVFFLLFIFQSIVVFPLQTIVELFCQISLWSDRNDRLAATNIVSNKLRRHSVSTMNEWTDNLDKNHQDFDHDGDKRVKFENRRYKIIKVFLFRSISNWKEKKNFIENFSSFGFFFV